MARQRAGFTLAVLKEHVAMPERERAELRLDEQHHGMLFCLGKRRAAPGASD
jgi:hypothetical protein